MIDHLDDPAPIPSPDGLPGKQCWCGQRLAPWYGRPPHPIIWAASRQDARLRNTARRPAHDVVSWGEVLAFGACRGLYPPPATEEWPVGVIDDGAGRLYGVPPLAGWSIDPYPQEGR